MAQPHVPREVVHVQHQSPDAIPQLVGDGILLVVEGDPRDAGQGGLVQDRERVVGHDPGVLVEWQVLHDIVGFGGLSSDAVGPDRPGGGAGAAVGAGGAVGGGGAGVEQLGKGGSGEEEEEEEEEEGESGSGSGGSGGSGVF